MRTAILAAIVALSALVAAARADNIIHFKGRAIDLDLYLQGYPYTNPIVDLHANKMFYKRTGKTDELMMISYDPASRDKVDLSNGRVVSPRDFSKRNWWGAAWSPLTKSVIILADENNDEIINLYSLDPATGAEKRLTNTSYIYGWRLSDDSRRIAYVTRATKDEMSPSEVRVLDLASGRDKIVYKDSPARKIVWTGIAWQPNGRGLALSFNGDGDRHHRNVLYVPLDGKARVVTDEKPARYDAGPLQRWLDDKTLLYTSDESGVTSVYRASLAGGPPVRVTAADENIKSAALLVAGARKELVVIVGDPLKSKLELLDPHTGAKHREEARDGQWFLAAAHDERAALSVTSLSVPFQVSELRLAPAGVGVDFVERVAYPDELLHKIINCDVEKVSFPTFDKLSAPGEHGTLHAYLLKPKQPQPKRDLRALVLAFYGGYNSFWTAGEILCQAGYYVMSPAPRGTSDFGTKFVDLAAGDWGGAETLDDFAAGKYLRDRLALPAQHIGIFGHSRGGYDTLRALTFPGAVNGVQESFRFGFGIAESGMSDIIRATKGGNISQWYTYLTGGDPEKDAAKWIDRSPETHADKLSGPLLLTHGSKDERVPVVESRAIYKKLKQLGKPVDYLELEGQGHSYVGIAAETKYWRALFDFLAKLP